jgi:hypothetical protein
VFQHRVAAQCPLAAVLASWIQLLLLRKEIAAAQGKCCWAKKLLQLLLLLRTRWGSRLARTPLAQE